MPSIYPFFNANLINIVFTFQLNGLLATLQKLPVGEKQTAINLLKVTVNHQLENSIPLKDKQALSETEKYFYQDGGSQCSIQEEVSQESESEFEQHPSGVNEGQEIDEDLCLNHEVPQSQVHPQVSHLKHTIGENISFNILHHLSDTDCLESTLSETDVKDDELSHKDSRSCKDVDTRKNVTSDLRISIDTGQNSQSNCCLKDNSVIHRKEDGILIQMASESQKHLLDGRTLYSLHSELKDDGSNENQERACLESLGKYSEVLHVCEQDRLLGHADEHTAVPLLTHNEQQLTLITSREFCEGGQEVSELRTILDSQDHDRDLSVLEDQSGHDSQDYGSGEPLLHLKIIGGKHDRSESKFVSCDKGNALNENSCSSLNLSHFHPISDRDNIYSEENSYLLPYLERDNYEKIGYKIESITKKSDQESLEKTLEASYSGSDFGCNERNSEMVGDLEHDKTPVDLSSTSNSVQNAKIDTSIIGLEESVTDPQQPQGIVSSRDHSHAWDRNQKKPSKAQHKQRQKRVRSENKRLKPAKHSKTSSLKEEGRFVEETNAFELDESDAVENLDINKESFHNMTLKEISNNIKGKDKQDCNFEASMSSNDRLVDLDIEKNNTEGSNEHLGLDVREKSDCLKEANKAQDKGNAQSSNMLPVSCRNCKKELPDVLLFLVHQRQCEGHLSCPICPAKFVHKLTKVMFKNLVESVSVRFSREAVWVHVTFSTHMEGHKRNICSKCSQSFCSHKKLKAHMKEEHNFDLVSKSYPCNKCSRTFLKRSSLYYHFKVHAVDDEEVCQKCGAFIKGKETFNLHMADHHKATKFHCNICSASFKRRQQYDDHLRV
ncbi:Zinc finger protein 1 [Portunus trituberculatus]|uniref:Zinc finger protein 1 n=1 Tax=Portunus trituberculatus TaxID=210409 RepID=A0A5B7EK92_PORTR|nr:Zinc finger protein 1 [Portunus trituberculatus]